MKVEACSDIQWLGPGLNQRAMPQTANIWQAACIEMLHLDSAGVSPWANPVRHLSYFDKTEIVERQAHKER